MKLITIKLWTNNALRDHLQEMTSVIVIAIAIAVIACAK